MDQIAKLQKYMQTPEAKKKSSAAKDKAWTKFINQFPSADVTKFVSQVSIDERKLLQRRSVSKQALTFCRACLALTENIGASK